MNEEVYLNEILELQKEVERLKRDNALLISSLRRYIDKDLACRKRRRAPVGEVP